MIVARSRTGSNLLIDLLNSHRNVFSYSEIFSGVAEEDVDRVYAKWRAAKPYFIRAVGFKLFYYHPAEGTSSRLWSWLEADTAIRVIHLRRLNTLDTLISQRLANATNQWARFAGDADAAARPTAVQMSAAELEEGFRETRDWERACAELFRQHAMLELSYEDLAADPETTAARVFSFLGLPSRQTSTRLVKQNLVPPSETLANWSELRDHFQGTEWEPYFGRD